MTTAMLPIERLFLWPIWWYGQGLLWLLKKVGSFLINQARSLNIVVWAQNLFVPMFGEQDTASRLISFFVRFFMIILKTIGWLLLWIPAIMIVVLWLGLLPAAAYLLVRQII
ncbi:hypothetical protein FWH30_01840 [Microgenomates group bacterium]|nr:hypothetical protein [Microgenomates group bacterium]